MAKVRRQTGLAVAFAIVTAVWIVAEAVAHARARQVRSNVALIVDDSLASIRLVERMGVDVERERVLLDSHIFEHDPAEMSRIETRIDAERADYRAAAHDYEGLVSPGSERDAWNDLQRDIDAVRNPSTAALAFSRRNENDEARSRIVALDPAFAKVDADVERLAAINGDGAKDVERQTDALEDCASLFRLGLTIAAALATMLLGAWATRAVAREQRRVAEYAAALETSNGELDAFSARVAHDLRGPLGTMRLAVATLAKGSSTVDILHRGVARMDALIGDLLTLSRVGVEGADACADVRSAAGTIEGDLTRRVEDVDGALRIDLEPASVRCDAGLLSEVIWNLGENAVKYRRQNARLELSIRGHAVGARYEIEVADNGAGMSPEDASHAFEPFFRGKKTSSLPGTGLGLSIVKRVVEACGGRITVRSAPDAGTTFVLDFPIARAT